MGNWNDQTRENSSAELNVSERLKHAQNVVIVGISGSGKSTVGKHLATLLGLGFLDLDQLIEKLAGKSIPRLFAEGEGVFREWEVKALESIGGIKSHVVALGGGALQDDRCLAMAKKLGPLIWLKPSADEVARRLYMKVNELEKRPLFKDLVEVGDKDERRQMIRSRIAEMTGQRSVMYQAADYVLDGGFVTPETSACQLKDVLISEGFPDVRGERFAIWRGSDW